MPVRTTPVVKRVAELLPGHELAITASETVDEKLIREYYRFVRERERKVDSEWGGRPIEERSDYREAIRKRIGGRILTLNWVDQELLDAIDADSVRAVFEPDGVGDRTVFDAGRIRALLAEFHNSRAEYVENRPPRTNPEVRFAGEYVAPLEFALERGHGIQWNF